jgi:light-regulated signal transduction histidine kinase (bacteriophytochrome)
MQAIEMNHLVQDVYDEVTLLSDRARLTFNLESLPMAIGDPSVLRQVLVNLLSNAVKYSSHRPQALIHVRGEQKDGMCTYHIQDNGAGFDMHYVSKLFGVFQRLHSEREFPGTGVGLAIAQRIVHRHGGQIWGEGRVDHGATFSFTLPAAQAY